MSTEAPSCPDCHAPIGTPINDECGVDKFYGREPGANLFCPVCGIGWRGTNLDVANAWRSWVEYEQRNAVDV